MKTLKDFEEKNETTLWGISKSPMENLYYGQRQAYCDLREEAKKWRDHLLKEQYGAPIEIYGEVGWINHFFNLEEKE